MMKSRWLQRFLRTLLVLLGAGLGAALALGLLELWKLTMSDVPLQPGWVIGAYAGLSLLGTVIFLPLSGWMLRKCGEWITAVEGYFSRLSLSQMIFSVAGLMVGLLLAALLSPLVGILGDSMFTMTVTAILYVLLAVTGLSVGLRRSEDLTQMVSRLAGIRERRASRKAAAGNCKVLDGAVLSDGRLRAVCATGFVDGCLIVPGFVLVRLKHQLTSQDALVSARARRALDNLQELQEDSSITLRTEQDADDVADEDVRLLRLAQQMGGSVLTLDTRLNKLALAMGVKVLNLNDLSAALRPVVTAGDVLKVLMLKPGKEAGQGVAYLQDGTMVVAEGGAEYLNQEVAVTATSVLQTSNGRMVFAKVE